MTIGAYPRDHEMFKLDRLQVLDKAYCTTLRQSDNFWYFCYCAWISKQGQTVRVPEGLPLHVANEATSVIKEHQAKTQTAADVEIKRVAEIRGSRFNSGKPRFDLIDGLAMEGLARVLTKGAEKYAAHNWRKGMPYMEVIASLERHIARIKQGEDIDSETGLLHADHIQCNAMFLSNMMKTRKDMDDRVPEQMNLRNTPLANTPEEVAAAFAAEAQRPRIMPFDHLDPKQPLAGDTNQATTFGPLTKSS